MTIRSLDCVLIYFVVFLFYIPCARTIAPGVSPPQIFKSNTVLKNSIINLFPCLPVFAFNSVSRYLKFFQILLHLYEQNLFVISNSAQCTNKVLENTLKKVKDRRLKLELSHKSSSLHVTIKKKSLKTLT